MACAVRSCKSTYRNLKDNPGIVSFHRFPSDPELKLRWLKNIGRADWLPPKNARVCSLHFENACYNLRVNNLQKKNLRIYAVPTIFENQPANIQQTAMDEVPISRVLRNIRDSETEDNENMTAMDEVPISRVLRNIRDSETEDNENMVLSQNTGVKKNDEAAMLVVSSTYHLNEKIRQLESKLAHYKLLSERRGRKLKNVSRKYSRLINKTASLKNIILCIVNGQDGDS